MGIMYDAFSASAQQLNTALMAIVLMSPIRLMSTHIVEYTHTELTGVPVYLFIA